MRCSWRSGRLYFEFYFLYHGGTRGLRTMKVIGNEGTEAEITQHRKGAK